MGFVVASLAIGSPSARGTTPRASALTESQWPSHGFQRSEGGSYSFTCASRSEFESEYSQRRLSWVSWLGFCRSALFKASRTRLLSGIRSLTSPALGDVTLSLLVLLDRPCRVVQAHEEQLLLAELTALVGDRDLGLDRMARRIHMQPADVVAVHVVDRRRHVGRRGQPNRVLDQLVQVQEELVRVVLAFLAERGVVVLQAHDAAVVGDPDDQRPAELRVEEGRDRLDRRSLDELALVAHLQVPSEGRLELQMLVLLAREELADWARLLVGDPGAFVHARHQGSNDLGPELWLVEDPDGQLFGLAHPRRHRIGEALVELDPEVLLRVHGGLLLDLWIGGHVGADTLQVQAIG